MSFIAVFILISISFSTALSSNTNNDENKESPLYRIRTRRAIGERIIELKEIIKTKFIGQRLNEKTDWGGYTEDVSGNTCDYSICTPQSCDVTFCVPSSCGCS